MRVGFDKKHQQYDKMQGKPQHRGDPREPSDFLNALCPRSYAYGFIQREGSSKQGQDCSLPHRAGQAGPGAPWPSGWSLCWKVLAHRRWPAGWVQESEACLQKTCGRAQAAPQSGPHGKGWWHGSEEQVLMQIPKQGYAGGLPDMGTEFLAWDYN